jgi:4-hydroxybenzoate polyprenyltransferase
LATSAMGCVVNDLWDRDIDPQVERTRQRPLAARTLSVKVGIAIALVALLCAAGLALYLTPLSFWLCVAAIPVIIAYPLAKRFFPIPQLVLAIAWGFAVLIPWSAVTGDLVEGTWVVWLATVFWTLGFDTVYAMSDREDDRRLGINSSAIFFGDFAAEAVGIFYACTLGSLLYLGIIFALNGFYWLALAIAAVGWVSHYIRLTDKDLPREVYGRLFAQNVAIGFVLLLGMLLSLS